MRGAEDLGRTDAPPKRLREDLKWRGEVHVIHSVREALMVIEGWT